MTSHSGSDSSASDSTGEGSRGQGNTGGMLSMIIKSIVEGPPRLGHPANPRGRSAFGRSSRPFDLSDLDDDDLFGSISGRPSRDPLDMLGRILGEEALDKMMGKGELQVITIGPDGAHVLHTGEASFSDIRRMKNGEDPLGINEMIKRHEENPPSRNAGKLSFLKLLDDGAPLALKLHWYAGHAGAEIVRFLAAPETNKDFAFVEHLAGILKDAQAKDKETFGNLQKRLKGHGVDLVGLIKAVDSFVEKRTVNAARSVQMRLAVASPVALALMDDVADALKSTRETLLEKLRSTSKI